MSQSKTELAAYSWKETREERATVSLETRAITKQLTGRWGRPTAVQVERTRRNQVFRARLQLHRCALGSALMLDTRRI